MFLIPFVAALCAVAYFWLASDLDRGWKLVASGALVASLAMQFTVLGEHVSFLVPTLIQVVLGLWGAIVMKMDRV